MQSEEFNWIKAKKTAEDLIFAYFAENLKDVEIQVLEGAWEGMTYEQMTERYHLSLNYLRGDIGSRLWKKLSEALGETVTKTNFKEALQRAEEKSIKARKGSNNNLEREIPFPSGSLSAHSPFYIQRGNVESLCYTACEEAGALIRIKAPKLMGKTSLINKILNHAQRQNYKTVYIDLQGVERNIVQNLDKLLRWLCLQVTRQLNLENQLKTYWDTDILGSNDNCTGYFEEYILQRLERPLVIALDTVDRLFEYREIIEDFFGMLRSWHEKRNTSFLWQNFRLIVSHATEAYLPLNINRSPFNAGFPVELSEFTPEQVKILSQLYKLDIEEEEQIQLHNIIGGHPYLVSLAFYHLSRKNLSFNNLLENCDSEAGIYRNHLRQYLELLQKNPLEIKALQRVVTSSEPVELDSIQAYKLHSLGLIQYHNNYVIPRFELYKSYFSRVL